MKDLIEALTILSKYVDDKWPTNCEHDVLYVKGPDPSEMLPAEVERLEELGFFYSDECWQLGILVGARRLSTGSQQNWRLVLLSRILETRSSAFERAKS